jgi:hypothetical protein
MAGVMEGKYQIANPHHPYDVFPNPVPLRWQATGCLPSLKVDFCGHLKPGFHPVPIETSMDFPSN